MNKTLVLAEKPSVARDIARVLNCHQKFGGYLEGNEYVVTWALGHLVTLADPEKYDIKYKTWNLDDLPMIPETLDIEVIKETSKQYSIVKNLMKRQDIPVIVIATDAGREGELVARWIIEKANVRKPIKRLWISSVTDKAIKDGFKQLKDGRLYDNLYHSAKARAEADWYVGINATRALTTKYNAQLSCGRVQTPTLAMIGKREEEIRNFKPRKYYGIEAISQQFKLKWLNKNNESNTFDKVFCDEIFNKLKNKDAIVIDVNKSFKKKYAPSLYDLTDLQKDANRIFNFSAKETLSVMQSLYEYHKILTYPRTDSRFLTNDIVPTIKDRLKACYVPPYQNSISTVMNKPIKASNHFVDDSKVSDHHAIIPTEQPVNLSKLNDRERKIYDLVVKRFLAVLYPPFEFEQVTVKTNIENEIFVAKGKRIIANGWKDIYSHFDEDEEQDDELLPELNKGDHIKIKHLNQTTGETKPPAPFTEGTLLQAMENPVKYMENQNKDLIRTLGDTGGLGTVATRADIIEKLFNIFLIEKRGKDIYITSKGKQLLDLVPNELKSPELTAKWEQKLSQIAKGNLQATSYIEEMKNYAKTVVSEIKQGEHHFKHDNLTNNQCPECGKLMLEVTSKETKMLVCQDRSCNHRKVISKITNARCPVCHKKLELVGEGESQIFICKCGHREKLSTFNERKKQEKNNLSKRDVSKYIHQINKESDISVNSSLADALKNLNIKK